MSIKLKDSEECLLWHLYITYLLHTLLATFLLLEKLTLTADIASIALRRDILTHTLDCLSRYYLGTDSSLDGYIKLLSWYQLLQLLTHSAAKRDSIVDMCKGRQCIDTLSIEEYVKLCEL